jgi:hypothetical protein
MSLTRRIGITPCASFEGVELRDDVQSSLSSSAEAAS